MGSSFLRQESPGVLILKCSNLYPCMHHTLQGKPTLSLNDTDCTIPLTNSVLTGPGQSAGYTDRKCFKPR